MSYATIAELYALGLSAQAFVSRARPYDAVDATTGTVRLKAHGLSADDIITFEVTEGGDLPTGVSDFTPYTPVVVSADLFRVINPNAIATVRAARNFVTSMTNTVASLAAGAVPDGVYTSVSVLITTSFLVGGTSGKYKVSTDSGTTWEAEVTLPPTAVSITAHGVTVNMTHGTGQVATAGYGFSFETYQVTAGVAAGLPFASWLSAGSGWAVATDVTRRLLAHLADASAVIDEHLTAEEPPILVDPATGAYPPTLVGLCARMAARSAVNSLQIDNAAYRVAVDRLFEREKQDLEMLAAWLGGKPIQPRPTDQTDVAENGAVATSDRDPTDWNTGVL